LFYLPRCMKGLLTLGFTLVLLIACSPPPPVVTLQATEVHSTPTNVILQDPVIAHTSAPAAGETDGTEPAREEIVEAAKLPEPTETPDPGANDLPDYYGGLVINLDYVGQTLSMRPKQGFLLRLGDEFTWTVSLSPADVVTANNKVSLDLSEQGVFVARKRGYVTLTAIGTPTCLRQEPPCTRPNVLYKMFIVVE
jgi:hypothetical protein